MDEVRGRPFSVTIVVGLVFIAGLLAVVAGFMRMFGWGVDDVDKNLWAGVITIAIGVVYLLVGRALAGGSGFARFLIALVTVINIALSVWVMVLTRGGRWIDSLILIFIGLVILALLYNARAREFFGR
jgi:hypothetical protein